MGAVYCIKITFAAKVSLFAKTKKIMVAAYQTPNLKRGRIFPLLFCINRINRSNNTAMKLLLPAITAGCHVTSLIKSPELLHKIAHKRIAY